MAGNLTPDELQKISSRFARLAEDAGRAAIEAVNRASSGLADDQSDWLANLLTKLAESEYRNRRRRADLFDTKFFGEAAWDMMLDLFINAARGQQVATTSLCIASSVPPTTALRWIGILEDQGLVHRYFCERDQRLHYVELTSKGANNITSYLQEKLRQLI